MTAPRLCVALGVTTATFVAGCGGDDRLTREEFVSEAEAICEEFDQRVEDVPDAESADDVERYVDELRPVIEDGSASSGHSNRPKSSRSSGTSSWTRTTRPWKCSTI
jgi:hypothetical protein